MKRIVLVILVIVSTLVGAVMNIPTLIDVPLNERNLIISLFVLVLWSVFVIINNKSKLMMIYTTVFWCMTFLIALLAIFSSITQISLGILNIPIIIFLSPIFGIRYIIHHPTGNLITMVIISLAFIISSYTLKERKMT